jgi:hypothetical protein
MGTRPKTKETKMKDAVYTVLQNLIEHFDDPQKTPNLAEEINKARRVLQESLAEHPDHRNLGPLLNGTRFHNLAIKHSWHLTYTWDTTRPAIIFTEPDTKTITAKVFVKDINTIHVETNNQFCEIGTGVGRLTIQSRIEQFINEKNASKNKTTIEDTWEADIQFLRKLAQASPAENDTLIAGTDAQHLVRIAGLLETHFTQE